MPKKSMHSPLARNRIVGRSKGLSHCFCCALSRALRRGKMMKNALAASTTVEKTNPSVGLTNQAQNAAQPRNPEQARPKNKTSSVLLRPLRLMARAAAGARSNVACQQATQRSVKSSGKEVVMRFVALLSAGCAAPARWIGRR